MFKNSGKKIMGLVKFIFYANAVIITLAVIGGTIWGIVEEDVGTGLLILLCGVIAEVVYLAIVYISLLCMFAFGELVQSSIDQRDLLRSMAKNPPAAPARYTPPVAPSNPVPPVRTAPPVAPERPAVRPAAPVAPTMNSGSVAPAPTAGGDHSAFCPHCGARQSSANNNCKYCGTPMR